MGKQKQNELSFPGFWPNPGPGRLPLDSGRADVEFAGVFASVASAAVSFVPESWPRKKEKAVASKTGVLGNVFKWD